MAAPNPSCPSFKKWRGISNREKQRLLEEAKSPVFAPKFNVYVPAEFQDLMPTRPKQYSSDDLKTAVTAIQASDKNQWLAAVTAIRKALSKEKNPPIQEVIDLGALPRLVTLMGASNMPKLQLEAAWAVCNVASGNSTQCSAVVKHGAVPKAIAMLSTEDTDLREQAAWLLGNVAGDGAALRDVCLAEGLLTHLLAAARKETAVKPLRQFSWLLCNVTRFKPRKRSDMLEVLPTLATLVTSTNDDEVLVDALSAMAHVADDCTPAVVTDARQVVTLAAKLLDERHENKFVALAAAKVLSALCAGDDVATQLVVNTGVLRGGYHRFLNDEKPADGVLREICFALSNIAAGTKAQAAAVVEAGLIPPLARVWQSSSNTTVQQEATWALANLVEKEDPAVTTAALEAGAGRLFARMVERCAIQKDVKVVGAGTAAAEALLRMATVGKVSADAGGDSNPTVASYKQDNVYAILQQAIDLGPPAKVLSNIRRLLDEFPPE